MSLRRSRLARLRSLVAGALLLVPGAAMADTLVVADARNSSLKPGQTIDADAPLSLKQGERVTLIAGNGASIKLAGPFDGVPDPGGQRTGGVAAALRQLASQTTTGTSSLGTVRAAPPAQPTDPWVVSVARPGDACVQDGAPVVFWTPKSDAERPIEIMPADRAWQAQATWPANSDQLAMPPTFPVADGQRYVVVTGGKPAEITLHVIPPAFSTDTMRAAFMSERGCTVQAQLLARKLPQ